MKICGKCGNKESWLTKGGLCVICDAIQKQGKKKIVKADMHLDGKTYDTYREYLTALRRKKTERRMELIEKDKESREAHEDFIRRRTEHRYDIRRDKYLGDINAKKKQTNLDKFKS